MFAKNHTQKRTLWDYEINFPISHHLKEINAGLKIHTEVDEHPINAFPLVFFLLKHEHVMVEELLKLLVTEVDANLFEAVELQRIWKGSVDIPEV